MRPTARVALSLILFAAAAVNVTLLGDSVITPFGARQTRLCASVLEGLRSNKAIVGGWQFNMLERATAIPAVFLAYILGTARGRYSGISQMQPADALLPLRVECVLASLASILLLFWVSRRLFSTAVALAAAFFFGLFFSIVFAAGLGSMRPVSVLAILVVWALALCASTGARPGTGVMAGLAAGYVAPIIPATLVFPALACLKAPKRRRWALASRLLAGAAAGFAIASVPALCDLPGFCVRFAQQRYRWAILDFHSEGLFSWTRLVSGAAAEAGLALCALSLLGIVFGLSRQTRAVVWPLAFAAAFLCTKPWSLDIGFSPWAALLPPGALLAALGASAAARRLSRATTAVGVLGICGVLLVSSLLPLNTLLEYYAAISKAQSPEHIAREALRRLAARRPGVRRVAFLAVEPLKSAFARLGGPGMVDVSAEFFGAIASCKAVPTLQTLASEGVEAVILSSFATETYGPFRPMDDLAISIERQWAEAFRLEGLGSFYPELWPKSFEGLRSLLGSKVPGFGPRIVAYISKPAPAQSRAAAPAETRCDRLDRLVGSLRDGSLVLLAVRGKPSARVWAEFSGLAGRIGGRDGILPVRGASFAFVGAVGATRGSAVWRAGVQEVTLCIDKGAAVGATGVRAPCDIVIRSIGDAQGPGRAIIRVHNVNLSGNQQGINIVVIDADCQCVARASFR